LSAAWTSGRKKLKRLPSGFRISSTKQPPLCAMWMAISRKLRAPSADPVAQMLFRHVLDLGDDAGAVGLPVLDGFFDQGSSRLLLWNELADEESLAQAGRQLSVITPGCQPLYNAGPDAKEASHAAGSSGLARGAYG